MLSQVLRRDVSQLFRQELGDNVFQRSKTLPIPWLGLHASIDSPLTLCPLCLSRKRYTALPPAPPRFWCKTCFDSYKQHAKNCSPPCSTSRKFCPERTWDLSSDQESDVKLSWHPCQGARSLGLVADSRRVSMRGAQVFQVG